MDRFLKHLRGALIALRLMWSIIIIFLSAVALRGKRHWIFLYPRFESAKFAFNVSCGLTHCQCRHVALWGATRYTLVVFASAERLCIYAVRPVNPYEMSSVIRVDRICSVTKLRRLSSRLTAFKYCIMAIRINGMIRLCFKYSARGFYGHVPIL